MPLDPDSHPPQPDLRRVANYLARDLRHDAISGLTVAIMGVPQAMAYAVIAGIHPIYGLYTTIVSGIVASIFGSSRHLVTGPSNASSMVILSVTARYMGHDPSLAPGSIDHHLEVIFLLTLITGFIKLTFGLLRMGNIVRYVSNSVVVGFTTGVMILIVVEQLRNIMGYPAYPHAAHRSYNLLTEAAANLGEINYYTLTVATLTFLSILLFRKISRKIPGPLASIAVASGLVYLLRWDQRGVTIVQNIGEIKRALDIFHIPKLLWPLDVGLVRELLPGALAVAISGLVDASTATRGVAVLSGQRLNFSREFMGQGIANIVGSFFSNFAASGSFVRTDLCYIAGGRTRMAPILCSVFTAFTVLALAPLANFIPLASLAGVLVFLSAAMIFRQRERILMPWRFGGSSRHILIWTFVATLLLPLQYAVFVGIFLSIFFLLQVTSKTDLKILVPQEDGRFDEMPLGQMADSPIVLIDMEGDLYFAAVENLDLELQGAVGPHTKVVVLRMKNLRAVGSTAMTMLENFRIALKRHNVTLVICGVEKGLEAQIKRSGLRDRVGEPNIFYADNTIFQSTNLAMARARAVVEMKRLAQGAAAETEEEETPDLWPAAEDLMTRQCVRFGKSHTVREAVWLMSEANRRAPGRGPQPLFLQDPEGKLAGELTPWRLLGEMAASLEGLRTDEMDARELGQRLSQPFDKVIGTLARTDLPALGKDANLAELVRAAVERDMRVIPICDESKRVTGLVREIDLIQGIGRALHVFATGAVEKKGNDA
jgi:sulfate permease, SulP family